MTSNKQIAYYPTQQELVEHIDSSKLALLRDRRAVKRLIIQQTLGERIFKTIAIASIVSASFFGISAVGCWGMEIIEANTKPIPFSKQQDWLSRKQICLGWMLVGFSSFLATAPLGGKPHQQSNE